MQTEPADLEPEEVTFELLKSTISMYDVVDMLGFEVNSQGFFRSPLNPDERTPSTRCWEDHWWDFSRGEGGDIIDLVQLVEPDWSVGKIVWQLWRRALRAGREPGDVDREPIRELTDFTDRVQHRPVYTGTYKHDLTPPHGAILCGEKPSEKWIPHREPGLVYGVKCWDPVSNKKWALPGSAFGHRLYNWAGWGDPVAPQVIICEGESDAWAMSSVVYGWDVLALPSGAGAWKDSWLSDLAHVSDMRVCMDNDRAGKQAEEKLLSKIGHDRALPLKVPQLYNDAREAIAAGWRPTL